MIGWRGVGSGSSVDRPRGFATHGCANSSLFGGGNFNRGWSRIRRVFGAIADRAPTDGRRRALRPDAPRLADWFAETHEATLACYVLEYDEVRRKLASTNSLERHHHEVRRRTRVIQIFPHEASLLRLLSALAIERNDRWRQRRWFIDPFSLMTSQLPMLKTA